MATATMDTAMAIHITGINMGTDVMPVPTEQELATKPTAVARVVASQWAPVVLALVSCRGNTKSAAESVGLPHEVYMLELTQHVEDLQSAIRAITLIDTFDMANKTRKFLAYSLDELKGQDLVKLYGDTLDKLEKLTDTRMPASGGTQHNTYNFGNVEQKMIQTLDPRVQAALLRARNIDPDTIDQAS